MAATKTKPVTFIAPKNKDLRVVKSPMFQRRTPEGIVYETIAPTDVIFEDHRATVEDPELIEWLRAHPDNFANDGGEERFMEEGFDEPKPLLKDQIEAIQGFARTGDRDGLVDLLTAEEEGHNRASVMDAGRAALMALHAVEEGSRPQK